MNTLTTTTTGTIAANMVLTHVGDYAGRYQQEAYEILSELTELPEGETAWADIMSDSNGNVYAIWAEDSLTCFNAEAVYLELNREDHSEYFESKEPFNISYETKGEDRLYVLWDSIKKEDEVISPDGAEIDDFVSNLGESFENFTMIEEDESVASYYGYTNCMIFGLNRK